MWWLPRWNAAYCIMNGPFQGWYCMATMEKCENRSSKNMNYDIFFIVVSLNTDKILETAK